MKLRKVKAKKPGNPHVDSTRNCWRVECECRDAYNDLVVKYNDLVDYVRKGKLEFGESDSR